MASRSTQASMVRACFMATSNTCVRLSIIASTRSFDPDDGRQRAKPRDRSARLRQPLVSAGPLGLTILESFLLRADELIE